MIKILLDTNAVDFFSSLYNSHPERVLDFLKNKEIYISLETTMELNRGFTRKIEIIDTFLEKFEVNHLGAILPSVLDLEYSQYPYHLNLKDRIIFTGGKIQELLGHNGSQDAIQRYNAISEQIISSRISLIREEVREQAIDFKNKTELIKKMKKWVGCDYSIIQMPYNTSLRLFLIEKFVTRDRYDIRDIRDMGICLNSIYFDQFITESSNSNILQKVKNKYHFDFVFLNNCEIITLKKLKNSL